MEEFRGKDREYIRFIFSEDREKMEHEINSLLSVVCGQLPLVGTAGEG